MQTQSGVWTGPGLKMNKIFAVPALVLAGAMVMSAAASAAPANSTAPEVTAPINWTGFYVGGDIGGLARQGHGTSDFFQDLENPHTLQGQSLKSSSGVAGVHVGFNWQFAPSWVAGIEGDWQWTRSRFSACREIGMDRDTEAGRRRRRRGGGGGGRGGGAAGGRGGGAGGGGRQHRGCINIQT